MRRRRVALTHGQPPSNRKGRNPKTKKHLFALFLALGLCLAVCLVSAGALAEGDPTYTFDAATGTLTLTGGDYDRNNNWGSDFTKSAVLHVTAQSGVRFVGDCRSLFNGFSKCQDIDLRNVDVSGMIYAWQIFTGAGSSLTSLNVAGWDVSGLSNMLCMFGHLRKLTALDLSSWDVSGVTNMEEMFKNCASLTSLNTAGWDVSHVTTMENMFYSCSGLTALDLSHWNVSSVTTMSSMFSDCSRLQSLNVGTWDVSSVTNMYCMFQSCTSLTALAELTLPAGVGVDESMCLNNGDDYCGVPGWIVQGDAAAAVVSGNGEYAVIAPAEQAATYIWRFNPALHPNAVRAFDAEGHWLYCPDCGRGLEGTYEEHAFDSWWEISYENIQRVQITVPNSNAQSLADLPANTPMGVGNTVQFINDEDEMSFTYLPDDSGRISCKDDASDSLYLPGGFASTPDEPYPAFANPKRTVNTRRIL